MPRKTARRQRNNHAGRTLNSRGRLGYIAIFEGIGVGLVAGLLVSLFRFLINEAEDMRDLFIESARQKFTMVLLGIGILVFISVCIAVIVQREPMASGSGIPQIKDEMKGKASSNWIQVIIAKFFGGILAIGSGLSLGKEDAGIQLGAMAGKGFSRLTAKKRQQPEEPGEKESLLMTFGSGAGFSAVFGAPLAGVIFTLEELHKNFSKEVLLGTMAAAITADGVGTYLFGFEPVLSFALDADEGLPISRIWMVILLGLILGALGVFFNKTVKVCCNLFKGLKPKWIKTVIPFVFLFALAIWMPEALGGDYGILETIDHGSLTVKVLLTLLIVKFAFSVISFGSGAPGGIIMPVIVVGAFVGGIFTEAISPLVGFEKDWAQCFAALGMAGFFSATVKTPITAIILISEMTGTFSNLFPLSIIVLVSYITADGLSGRRSRPIFD